MVTKVRRIDGDEVSPTSANFRRLTAVKANLRKGYQVEYAPYPNEDGKWLIRIVRPKGNIPTDYVVDSYYEIIARSHEEAKDFILNNKIWDNALAERVAHRIGRLGEAHAMRRLSAGTRVVDDVTGKGMIFSAVKKFPNKSDNGVDLLAQIKEVDPPPPPSAGDFVAFEVKSTLGVADNPPGLSRAQKKPEKFVRSRLMAALDGEGSYPILEFEDQRFIKKALNSRQEGKLHYRKVDIRMDHSGALSSMGGKPELEFKLW